MKKLARELETYCELHWWNMGKKTVSFKGTLDELLRYQGVTFTTRKTDKEGLYNFHFKSSYGISYKVRNTISDFKHSAKQFIQMELVRMGDKSQLYVNGCWRSTVTINF
jgi:hypothetical protein